jgi:hypothetical protein
MAKEKKTVANAAGNGVTASKVVSGAAEQVKVFEAVIEYRSMDDIKCNSHNARTHSPKQIQQISASIKAFGLPDQRLGLCRCQHVQTRAHGRTHGPSYGEAVAHGDRCDKGLLNP